MKTLIVAEKRSVGEAIAAVVGARDKKSGYISGEKFLVSWARGHLVEASRPEQYNASYAKWNISDLPIIPDIWCFDICTDVNGRQQYDALAALMSSAEVGEIICATDAGREGELIFRLIYNQAGCKKTVSRLWISSLEEESIKTGLAALKPGTDYDNLYAAASARQKSDWIVGMNLTRLYSCSYNLTLNIGRVQTPTVNLIVERQYEIDSFVPQPYYVITADCGSFKATTKVNDKRAADEVLSRCNGKDAYITKLEEVQKSQSPPLLYDLTSLQRDANRMFGFTAQQTLKAAQSLYDSKLITYPRTDSRFITTDMIQPTGELIQSLLAAKSITLPALDVGAIVNDNKVSDHHALLPTASSITYDTGKLSDEQITILKLITWRLLSAVCPPSKYLATKVYLDIESESFAATGKQITEEGFAVIESLLMKDLKPDKKEHPEEDAAPPLPPMSEGDIISNIKISNEKKQTQPPKPYTEDTLLSALEHAGTSLTEKELKDALKGCGLGTPATRAGIIEKVIEQGFIERKGNQKTKTLHPTRIAAILMDLLPDNIKSAEMTAEWESKLSHIQYGALSEDDFLTEIADYIKRIVATAKMLPPADNPFQAFIQPRHEVIGTCPRCGSEVYEGQKNFYCSNKEKDAAGNYLCGFSMWKADRFFVQRQKELTAAIAKDLLKCGRSLLKSCKPKDPAKKPYDINIFLDDTGTYVNFKFEFIN